MKEIFKKVFNTSKPASDDEMVQLAKIEWPKANPLVHNSIEDMYPRTMLAKPVESNTNSNEKEEEKEMKKEEKWIWVEGYKGTDKNMCCRDYQFELGKKFDMPEDAAIKECESGFHLCLKQSHVCTYYDIKEGNRFFKVRALVREDDYEKAKKAPSIWTSLLVDSKLTSKSIEFISELTVDEILADRDTTYWTKQDKIMALEIGVKDVLAMVRVRRLRSLGYSKVFAQYVVDRDAFDVANAVGSQSDLSMDVKVMMICKKII